MSGAPAPRARVTIESRRLWSLRVSLAATRWLLYAAALAGIAATARNAIAPAAAAPAVSRPAAPVAGDAAAAQWFALRFARAYLGWSGDLGGHEAALVPFLAAGTSPDAGLAPAPHTAEAVGWDAIADARPGAAGATEYTVAVGTASGAVRYLALAVGDGARGPRLLRYPALVGAPVTGAAASLDGAALPALAEPALAAVLDRALRNYLAASAENLAADLAPGAMVAPVAPGLSLRTVVRLAVAGPRDVLATVVAADATGTTYTLAYEIAVSQLGGRWEITQIEP